MKNKNLFGVNLGIGLMNKYKTIKEGKKRILKEEDVYGKINMEKMDGIMTKCVTIWDLQMVYIEIYIFLLEKLNIYWCNF